MPHWGLIVEQNIRGDGSPQDKRWIGYQLDSVEGTWEQAMQQLLEHVWHFRTRNPTNPRRRRVYREPNGFLLLVAGKTSDYHARFSVCELLCDTGTHRGEPRMPPVPQLFGSPPQDAPPPPVLRLDKPEWP